jgi:uncharacterized phage-like protein YoqJ
MATLSSMVLAATINGIIFSSISSFDSQSAYSSSYLSGIDKQYTSLSNEYKPPQPILLQLSENETQKKNNFIAFTVYHTSYSDSIMKVLKKHFNDPNTKNYLYEDTRVKAVLDDFSSEFNFIIGGTSYNEITKNKFQIAQDYHFDSNDIIVYDIENRPSTPRYEKMDPVSSISKVMQSIRSQGYKAGVTPDYEFITTYYKKIEWENVDFLGIQIQRFTNNYELLLKWAAEISAFVKAKNPNIEVFVQLSFRHASNCYDSEGNHRMDNACKVDVDETMRVLKENLSAVAQLETVDGFIISYPNYSCPTELCTPSNLDMIMTHIENIKR